MLRHGAPRARRLIINGLWRRHIQSLPNALAMGAPIDVHPEVQHALAKNEPVVALETTIVTHGMPQPTNLETAKAVEGIVRAQGAIPATIGIIQGRVKIGLRDHELEHLADVHNTPVVKVSRRDLGPVLALQRNGGTTCSTTLIFAAMAGIKVWTVDGISVQSGLRGARSSLLEGNFFHLPESVDLDAEFEYRLGGVHRGGENSEWLCLA